MSPMVIDGYFPCPCETSQGWYLSEEASSAAQGVEPPLDEERPELLQGEATPRTGHPAPPIPTQQVCLQGF